MLHIIGVHGLVVGAIVRGGERREGTFAHGLYMRVERFLLEL